MNGIVRSPGQSLATLLAGFGGASAPADISVNALQLDSRQVAPGDLFVALRGDTHDGRQYLSDAARAGAVAALVEDELPEGDAELPVVVVPALRRHLGEIAGRFFGHPSRAMHVAAVTGTNGKTTVSQLFAQLTRACGYDCGVIGTLGASLDGRPQDSTHTTPDAIALQACLASWAAEAVPFVGMEASSHALAQWRLSGLDVDTAVFTNLTRDHLDYHGDMASYGDAKATLFAFESLRSAIINIDDPFGAQLLEAAREGIELLRYGSAQGADLRFSDLALDGAGMRFALATPWGEAVVSCPLLGAFNAHNLVAAIGAALKAGLPFDRLVEAAGELSPVAGRMEPLQRAGSPLVVVDYAHTPDALAQVLRTLRPQCQGRLIAVFGCGGDRDRGKRPLMAEAASTFADHSVVTSDNPRTEDPAAIIADVVQAMGGSYGIEVDRAAAIQRAIHEAQPDDCVLVAGKGHEDYQVIGETRRPFSDREIVTQALEGYAV